MPGTLTTSATATPKSLRNFIQLRGHEAAGRRREGHLMTATCGRATPAAVAAPTAAIATDTASPSASLLSVRRLRLH